MKNHIYVLLSVFLWGISQFLLDHLLFYFSPTLLLFMRFFLSGIILLLAIKIKHKTRFRFGYLITGGLGCFGYYILIEYALQSSSAPFVSIMGGVLPSVAILSDFILEKIKPNRRIMFGAVITVIGMYLFSYKATYQWSKHAVILMILANICWVMYCFLKKKTITENGIREFNKKRDKEVRKDIAISSELEELSYEFISAGVLTLPFASSFRILKNIDSIAIMELLFIVFLATVIPYWMWLKGSKLLPLSTSTMYLNLLPVMGVMPSFMLADLEVNVIQKIGLIILIVAVLFGADKRK